MEQEVLQSGLLHAFDLNVHLPESISVTSKPLSVLCV